MKHRICLNTKCVCDMFTHLPSSSNNVTFASDENSTNVTGLSPLINETKEVLSNGGGGGGGGGGTVHGTPFTDYTPPREFPLPLIVASSVAAVSILIFFCVAYYWHSYQLDKRAQELAIQRAAEDVEAQIQPRRRTRHGRKKHIPRQLDLPSPTVNGPKKSSVVSDQEVLTHFASRRQSIFF